MSWTRLNNCEGGANANAISTSDSGGPGGTSWDAVVHNSEGGGTTQYTNAQKYEGALSINYTGQFGSSNWGWNNSTPGVDIYSRVYARLSSLNSQIGHFAGSSAGVIGALAVNSSGTLAFVAGASGAGTTVLATATWYRFEIHLHVGISSTGYLEAYVYSSAGTQLDYVKSSFLSTTGWNSATGYVRFGQTNFGTGNTTYYDTMAASDQGWVGAYVPPTTPISDTEVGSGAEAGTAAASLSSSDSETTAEASSLAAAFSAADSGTSAEAASLSATASSADTAGALDSQGLSAALTGTDNGGGLDGQGLSLSNSEISVLAESSSSSATLAAADSVVSSDTDPITGSLSDNDSSSSFETYSLQEGDHTVYIKAVTISAGATVGLFASLGATVATSTVATKTGSPTLEFVANSGGTGDTFPVDNVPFVSSTEVYVKNTGAADETLLVRITS